MSLQDQNPIYAGPLAENFWRLNQFQQHNQKQFQQSFWWKFYSSGEKKKKKKIHAPRKYFLGGDLSVYIYAWYDPWFHRSSSNSSYLEIRWTSGLRSTWCSNSLPRPTISPPCWLSRSAVRHQIKLELPQKMLQMYHRPKLVFVWQTMAGSDRWMRCCRTS